MVSFFAMSLAVASVNTYMCEEAGAPVRASWIRERESGNLNGKLTGLTATIHKVPYYTTRCQCVWPLQAVACICLFVRFSDITSGCVLDLLDR